MMLRPAVAIALCLAWFSLSSSSAKADLVIAFSPDGQTTSANVSVNDSLSINIYLRDTFVVNSSTPSPLINSGFNFGLGKFSLEGNFDSGKIVLNPPPPSSSSFTIGASFPNSPTYNPGADQFTVAWTTNGAGVYGDSSQAGAPLLLGTVHFTAVTAGSYTLSISDPNPLLVTANDIIFGPPNSPVGSDAAIFGPTFAKTYDFTVNVSAVPEPGSMSLVALASGGLWLARRRFRRVK